MAIVKKVKKKNWHQILAPELFNKQVVGEMFVSEPQKAINRFVTVNLMSLTNDPKRQNINVQFKINDFKDNKFFTEMGSYEVSPNSIRRLVRRGRDKVDDSFLCRTSDNKIIRVKTLFLTSSNTNNSVLTNLRKESRKILNEYVSKKSYVELVSDVISYKVQSLLKKALKKVHPLKISDIRALEIAKGKVKFEEQLMKPEAKKAELEEEEVQEKAEEEKTEVKEAKAQPKEKPAKEKEPKKEPKQKKSKEDKNA